MLRGEIVGVYPRFATVLESDVLTTMRAREVHRSAGVVHFASSRCGPVSGCCPVNGRAAPIPGSP